MGNSIHHCTISRLLLNSEDINLLMPWQFSSEKGDKEYCQLWQRQGWPQIFCPLSCISQIPTIRSSYAINSGWQSMDGSSMQCFLGSATQRSLGSTAEPLGSYHLLLHLTICRDSYQHDFLGDGVEHSLTSKCYEKERNYCHVKPWRVC